jgi:hypothetical protein
MGLEEVAPIQPVQLDRVEVEVEEGAIAKPFDPLKLAQQVSQALGWPAE